MPFYIFDVKKDMLCMKNDKINEKYFTSKFKKLGITPIPVGNITVTKHSKSKNDANNSNAPM